MKANIKGIIHKDPETVYGVSFPTLYDVVFNLADTLDELPEAVNSILKSNFQARADRDGHLGPIFDENAHHAFDNIEPDGFIGFTHSELTYEDGVVDVSTRLEIL